MPQIFHRGTNAVAKASIVGAVVLAATLALTIGAIDRSNYNTGVGVEVEQPVQFSHKHHTGDDGIDCRYCHSTAEVSNSAGIPPTKTCMNCHSQIWADSPYLEPVRESWRTGQPIKWNKVHDVPDYVYFNHSIHVNKGVGCSTCHGNVAEMPYVYKVNSMKMEWCLQCHREPEKYLRPKDKVWDVTWEPPADQLVKGLELKREYHVANSQMLTSCSTCHR